MDAKGNENIALYEKVKQLDTLHMDAAEAPANIEVCTTAVSYSLETTETQDFKDRTAFPASDFIEETKALEELAEVLKKGNEFASWLYTYRSCSKALPMVGPETEEKDRNEIHSKTFEILRPQVLKMRAFREFVELTVNTIRKNVQVQVKIDSQKLPESQVMFDLLLAVIDVLIVLDALKDMKASVVNDFSRYKRAFQVIRAELRDADAISGEIHDLQMFLSNPQNPHNYILYTLKTDVLKITGFDGVVASLITHALDAIEGNRFVLPEENHTFHRALPNLMYMMDQDAKSGINPFKHKRVPLDRIIKIFRTRPILPLYGDMHIELLYVLRRCPHWDESSMLSSWKTSQQQKIHLQYEIKHQLPGIRAEYTSYVVQWTILLNEIKAFQAAGKSVTPSMLKRLFDTCLQGVRMLSSWSGRVKEQCAFKFYQPVSDDEYARLGGRGQAGKEYEKVVRYNYKPEELYALVDVIGMIKGLSGLMLKSELMVLPLLRRHIHDEFQIFLQGELARPLRKAHKRSRAKVKEVMLAMRDIGGDWLKREEGINDYLKPAAEIESTTRDFPRRATAPSPTQLVLVRSMMFTVFSPKAPGMQGGFFTEKDLKPEWATLWEDFYTKSFFYKYLLDYAGTIRTCSDLSHLWYREFYLEMTKCVQFPIAMSLPWILTDFLVRTPSMKENLFYPMDIYNDAAAKALNEIKQQFLYDEIEAELNLSFDQLIFHLSEDIFVHFKTQASSMLLDKPYRKVYEQYLASKQRFLSDGSARYIGLMSQRNLTLLGRSVDLPQLITEHVNRYMRQNLTNVIKRFEASELTGVVLLQQLLDNLRLTHVLLSEFLSLDPFESMFREVNENVSLGSFRGRIVMHVFSELLGDVLPNYCFNNTTYRFVASPNQFPEPYVETVVRDSMPSSVPSYMWFGRGFKEAFERKAQLLKGYVGVEHVEAILSVLSPSEVPLIVHELTQHIDSKIRFDFKPYVDEMVTKLPPMKLPGLQYGVIGCYGFFDLKLRTNIGAYGDMRPGVFQCLREIGNGLAFLHLLELVQNREEDLSFGILSYHQGLKVSPFKPSADTAVPFSSPSGAAAASGAAEQKYEGAFGLNPMGSPSLSTLQASVEALQQHPTLAAHNKQVAAQASALFQRAFDDVSWRPGPRRSLLTAAIHTLAQSFEKNLAEWAAATPVEGMLLDPETPRDILRLWSCLQFLYCQIPEANPCNLQEGATMIDDMLTFGDGFHWAGMLFLHLLALRQRLEYLDFSYYVNRVEALFPLPPEETAEQKKKKTKGPEQAPTEVEKLEPQVRAFLRNVRIVKAKNDLVLSILESHYPIILEPTLELHPQDEKKLAAAAQAAAGQPRSHVAGAASMSSFPSPASSASASASASSAHSRNISSAVSPAASAPAPAPAAPAPPAPAMSAPPPPMMAPPAPPAPAMSAPPAPMMAPPAPPAPMMAPPAPPAPPMMAPPAPPAPPMMAPPAPPAPPMMAPPTMAPPAPPAPPMMAPPAPPAPPMMAPPAPPAPPKLAVPPPPAPPVRAGPPPPPVPAGFSSAGAPPPPPPPRF